MSAALQKVLTLVLIAGIAGIAAPRLAAQVEWDRETADPVLPAGAPGDWDAQGVGAPFVLELGDELHMWYVGVTSRDPWQTAIGRAVSEDGEDWIKTPGPVFVPDRAGWENGALSKAWILPAPVADGDSCSLQMWYSSISKDPCQIGLATSPCDDGLNWDRAAGNPLFPIVSTAPWESRCIDGPSVVVARGKHWMWYAGGPLDYPGFRQWKIGLATSEDGGATWTRYAGNPVLSEDSPDLPGGVLFPSVRYDEATDTFEMWYSTTRVAPPVWRIHYATSADGIHWAKHEGNPVLDLGLGWDLGSVAEPSVLFDGRDYRMWYAGVVTLQSPAHIGLAIAPWSIPRASFAVETSAVGDLTFAFDASKSLAPKGEIAGYSWDFGDGEQGTGSNASHTYALPGRYVVTLTVTDGAGNKGSVTRGVEARLPDCDLSPWTSTDVGAPFYQGGACASEMGGCLEIAAGGATLASGRADQFHFVHQEIEGDAAITARVQSASGPAGRQVGVMLRESLEPGARHLTMALRERSVLGERATRFSALRREATGGSARSADADGADATPGDAWVRVERIGEQLMASYSNDGCAWTELQRLDFSGEPLPARLFAGIAAAGPDPRTGERFNPLSTTVCDVELAAQARPCGGPPRLIPFHRGDPDASGTVDLSDAVTVFRYLFIGGGAAPSCLESADSDNDGKINISDGIYLLRWLFLGGPEPFAPGPTGAPCGVDPDPAGSPGDLGCDAYGGC